MQIPDDVRAFIESSFPLEQWGEAILVIGDARIQDGTTPSHRLLRCVAFACHGNMQWLKQFTSLLARDWRDVIMAGEYEFHDKALVQVRDFTNPMQV